jgi:hypothetical protein
MYADLPTLFAAIRLRPGMFLGRKTIRGLHLFLSGIRFAEDFHGLPAEARISGFDSAGFERWVESKYNACRLSLNSCALAAHLAGADDFGFDLWFRWYDEFACVRPAEPGTAASCGGKTPL